MRPSFWQRVFLRGFLHAPSAFIAEPFEIFLVVLGLLDAVALLLHYAQGTLPPGLLDVYKGRWGLILWATWLGVASVMLVYSLATMEQKNLLSIRKLEIVGMWMYAVAFAWYGYANVTVGLSLARRPAVYTALTEAIVVVLAMACIIRALALSSQVTALSVTRVHRVRQIKDVVRELLNDGDA
jgi:hypothetical protein